MRKSFLLITATLLFPYPFAALAEMSPAPIEKGWWESGIIKSYFYHSELQRQWAFELLGKQRLNGSESVLDFGCGDGKITAEMALLLPQGTVTGTDVSPAMIRFARSRFPPSAYANLQFTVNLESASECYDLITSFCVFHLLQSPSSVLRELHTRLKASGKLLLVIPAGRNPEFFQAAQAAFDQFQLPAPWDTYSPESVNMRSLEGCGSVLEAAGYLLDRLEMVDTPHTFIDREEFLQWLIGTMTANWSIPVEKAAEFFDYMVDRMQALDDGFLHADGTVRFKLSRIHAVASPCSSGTL